MSDPKENDDLPPEDIDWLQKVKSTLSQLHTVLPLERAALLRLARRKLKAEYVFFGIAQHDWDTGESAILEFFDDAETDNPEQRRKFKDYSRVTHLLNNDRIGAKFFMDITAKIERENGPKSGEHVTAESTRLKSAAKLWTKLEAVTKLLLFKKRDDVGLDDFMFTLYRFDKHVGGGIGYHRRKGDPKFTPRDRRLADRLSRENLWLYSHSIDQRFDATKLTKQQRLALPLLLTTIKDGAITDLLNLPEGWLRKRIIEIGTAMKLPEGERTRNGIKTYFRGPSLKLPISLNGDQDWRDNLDEILKRLDI